MMMDTAITTTINTTPPVTTDATITMESGIAELAIVVTSSSELKPLCGAKTQARKQCSKKMKA